MIFLLWFFPPPVPPTLLKKGPLAELLPACVFFLKKRVFQVRKLNTENLFFARPVL
jgi:hypothetical protein